MFAAEVANVRSAGWTGGRLRGESRAYACACLTSGVLRSMLRLEVGWKEEGGRVVTNIFVFGECQLSLSV